MGQEGDNVATIQLDSHSNMVVVGKQATDVGDTGKKVDVGKFSNDCSKLESNPIVDAAVAYDCPFLMKTYILKLSNTFYVKSMEYNLILPFIIQEVGLKVNNVPRIQTKVEDLTDETHCIVVT